MPGPPLHSLVKYDTPSLLTTNGKAGAKKGAAPAKGGKKQLPFRLRLRLRLRHYD